MAESRKPTHQVFAVLDQQSSRNDENKSLWIRIGAAWTNQDGSLTCLLDSTPLAWQAGWRGAFKLIVQERRDDHNDRDGNGKDDRRDNTRNDRGRSRSRD